MSIVLVLDERECTNILYECFISCHLIIELTPNNLNFLFLTL
ncbi:hypothetical protein MtrunA17_Chr3g0109911 [Medicago truncatula]|uniref:Uncharacterized protein n=1 Tax=Medicago truncatula TaxID=3880 RepID=A0A396ITQ6_MEDTR|nr:hypothetical protein MtrunA17_Chr3g0109911 [Medicago truncatula]